MNIIKKVLFTDMDATLLDPVDYSYGAKLEFIQQLKETGVPIIFCSSKTKAEQEVYRELMNIDDPFVVENGSAIYIPKNYFSVPFDFDITAGEYYVIELGVRYGEIRKVLGDICKKVSVKFFGNMSVEEVAEATGLSVELASLAKKREYSETLILDESNRQSVLKMIEEAGYNWTYGGRFYSIMGRTDKGMAVKRLTEIFEREYGNIVTIAVGDSVNDLPMLEVVDMPFLIKNERNDQLDLDLPDLRIVNDFGDVVDIIL